MTERARWLLLVLTLLLGLGGAVTIALWRIEVNAAASQRELCGLIGVFTDPGGPPPSTERSRRQVEALNGYLDRRCR